MSPCTRRASTKRPRSPPMRTWRQSTLAPVVVVSRRRGNRADYLCGPSRLHQLTMVAGRPCQVDWKSLLPLEQRQFIAYRFAKM